MKSWNFTAAAVCCGLCLGMAGCQSDSDPRSQDAACYDRIADKLEPGGSYYRIMNPRYVLEGADKLSARLFDMLAFMREPPKNLPRILDRSLNLALLYRLSGIEDVQGIGESSIRLSGEHEKPLFRNRLYLAVKPGSRGFLWNFAATENRDLRPAWEKLPAEVDSALEFDLRPDEGYRILAENETLAANFHNARVAAFIGEPLEKLLAGVAGRVRFASIAAEESDPEAISGSHLMISLPDQEGKLFAMVKKIALLLPGARAQEGRIQLGTIFGEEAPKATPVILAQEERITLFSSVKAEKAFTSPGKRLVDSDKFQRLTAGLPTEGIGFFYNSASFAQAVKYFLTDFNLKVNPKLMALELFAVVAREPGGFLEIDNSTLDCNQSKLICQILIPAGIGMMVAKNHLFASDDGEETVEAPDTTGECQRTLELFRSALKGYAEQHDGAFPAGENLEGIRELLKAGLLPLQATVCPGATGTNVPAETADAFADANCSFLYFGGLNTKSNPKLPLVTDWPLNHAGAVNALLVDGTIVKLDIDAKDCKRIVSKLQTIYLYKEKDFRRMIELADKLDRKYELDQQ